MVAIALWLDLVFVVVAFAVRTWVQRRRTGDWGWRLGRPDSAAEGLARVLLLGSAVAIVAALVTAETSSPAAVAGVSVAIAIASVALVGVAQLQMAESWRIGVDPDERTELVRSGLYAYVRNPIYAGMAAYAIAHVGLTPSPAAVVAALSMVTGVELQVRLVEEPYLHRVHGTAYRTWTHTSGRFVPRLGRSSAQRRRCSP
jgi:protein-S-isoprenylcysteine O-methyltransferase Ste14